MFLSRQTSNSRRARLNPQYLNALIVAFAVLIGIDYLIGVSSRSEKTLGIAILASVALGVLFFGLDVLVFLRLSPAVAAAVKSRVAATGARVVLTALALLAVFVAVAAFFGAACGGMLVTF